MADGAPDPGGTCHGTGNCRCLGEHSDASDRRVSDSRARLASEGHLTRNRDDAPATGSGISFSVSSTLAAPAATVWKHAASVRGVNVELWPLVFRAPPEAEEDLALERAPIVQALLAASADGTARIPPGLVPPLPISVSLFGILQLDTFATSFESITPGRSFSERSTSWAMARWSHSRTVVPLPSGGGEACRVTDVVAFRSRLPALHCILAPVYRQVFRRRHAVLQRVFGTPPFSSAQPRCAAKPEAEAEERRHSPHSEAATAARDTQQLLGGARGSRRRRTHETHVNS